jgi:hypothetical protein
MIRALIADALLALAGAAASALLSVAAERAAIHLDDVR